MQDPPSALQLGLAGGCAILVGIGLARFAYTPLIPALIQAHWFSPSSAAYLGAANLLGYLFGAVAAHRIAQHWGPRRVLGWSLLLTVISLLACARPWGFAWYAFWRGLAGITGALLMVLAPPAALSRVPARDRPRSAAVIFTGVGLGIILAGTLVPWLAALSLTLTWLALGLLAGVLALVSWPVWRALPDQAAGHSASSAAPIPALAFGLVLTAYALDAVGFVPHTLFWVDYIARELGRGLRSGGHFWMLFGVGAVTGPMVAGILAGRVGFHRGLTLELTLKAAGVALPLLSSSTPVLAVSSLLVGMLVPGVVTMASGRVAELVPLARQQQAWGWMTTAFAMAQAAAGYSMSWAYDQIGSYRPLFAVAAVALAAAVACAVLGRRHAPTTLRPLRN